MILRIPQADELSSIGTTIGLDSTRYDENDVLKGSGDFILKWEEIQELLKKPISLPYSIEIHIIRHAESEINAQKRITGAQDVKLTSKGREQAKQLGHKLDRSYDVAYTSTLERARETLNIALVSGDVNVSHVFRDPRLNERSLGILEGRKQHKVLEYAAGNLDYAPINGESYREVAQRILSFLCYLAVDALEGKFEKILICSHMGPMRIMAGILEDIDNPVDVLNFYFSNAEVLKISWKNLRFPKFLN